MLPETFSRLLIAAALFFGGWFLFQLINRRTLQRAQSRLDQFPAYRPGLPALVYFTTPTCAPCKTVQRPAIISLQMRWGEAFQVIEIDASASPHLAQDWGVLSVPTTFIFDSQGQPRYVNHGVTPAKTILQQLDLEDYTI